MNHPHSESALLKVVIAEALHADSSALGEGIQVVEDPTLWSRPEALVAQLSDAAGLIVRNQTPVDAGLIERAPRLRAVGRLGAGLDNIDQAALRARSIALVHGGGLNARAVAEYVVGAALALSHRLALSDRQVRAGLWERHVGVELRGRTLGVLGLGATGAEVCRLGQALGMRVLGFDPVVAPPPGVPAVPLDELLKRSQVLSLHVPLTGATRNLLDAGRLAMLPAGAIVINAARGGVVDEAALAECLRAGRLGGAALDVRLQEPPLDDPLRKMDQVLLTAHLAGLTEESQAAIADHVLRGVREAVLAPGGRP